MKNRMKAVALILAWAVVFAGGYTIGSLGKSSDEYSEDFIRTSREMTEILEDNYYLGVDQSELEDGMLHGLAQSVGDPYTYYLNASELVEYTAGNAESYEGIGVLITLNDNGLPMVTRVFSNSPAQSAGIVKGDVFTEVDGEDIQPGTSLDDLSLTSSKLRGEPGTDVMVTLMREMESITLTLTRAAVDIEYVESRMLTGDIGYVSLSDFSMHCADEVQNAIQTLSGQGMKKLIFDLRFNPGGYVNSAVQIADLFLDEGVVVYTVYADGSEEEYLSYDDKYDIPLVVLVNEYSASSAEILTGALKDRGAATVVGTKTYGKGIIQLMYPLSGGGALNVTIASYSTPDGTRIHGIGIEPDVQAQLPEGVLNGTVSFTDENDTQLQTAIDLLK